MKALLLVGDTSADHFRRALDGGCAVVDARDAEDFCAMLEARRPSVVVVDPDRLRDDVIGKVRQFVIRCGIPVVICSELRAAATPQVLAFVAGVHSDVIAHDCDNPEALRRVVMASAGTSVPAAVLHSIEPRLHRLRPTACAAIIKLFAWGSTPRSVRELCLMAESTPDALRRDLQRAGLAEPRRLLDSGRLARATEHLFDGQAAIATAFRAAGFTTRRTFELRVRAAFGESPRSLARRRDRASATAQLITRATGVA